MINNLMMPVVLAHRIIRNSETLEGTKDNSAERKTLYTPGKTLYTLMAISKHLMSFHVN